jgi:Na+/H+ antiporter NhaD/arsenite permease-like protein
MDAPVAVAIFVVAFVLIIGERIHRTTVALAGAVLMVFVGIEGYGQEEAFSKIDLNVIFLLVGMMIIVNVLSRTGVFQWLSIRSAKLVHGHGLGSMLALSVVTAVASAFLDNVTTVILITPVTLILADSLQVRPAPILIAQALASNIGGAATLVGDPPNILIGSAADLTFVDFAVNMAPISLITLAPSLALIAWLARHELNVAEQSRAAIMALDEDQLIVDPHLLRLSLAVLMTTIVGFVFHGVLGLEAATIALAGAALLLLVTREDPHETLREVEWSTILFFVGLFVMVGGLESVGVLEDVAQSVADLAGGSETTTALLILWLSGGLSGIVDNIPYTTATIPVIMELNRELEAGDTLWWALAMGADLGGNLTIIGASANVLIANLSARGGQPISFWEFFRYGSGVTLLSLLLSSGYLWLRYLS